MIAALGDSLTVSKDHWIATDKASNKISDFLTREMEYIQLCPIEPNMFFTFFFPYSTLAG